MSVEDKMVRYAPNAHSPTADAEEKKKALQAAKIQIEKEFGTGAIMKFSDKPDMLSFSVVPSGSILLDEALGVGGYPRGRIIEMYGPESSGKTTMALHAIAETQKLGGIAAFIDVEHALDPSYAKNLGVDIDELWVSQPDSGEQALTITENLITSGAIDIVVVDSVAALTPQSEIESDMGSSQMGMQARLMSQAMRKLAGVVSKSRTILVFINQIRMKIGVMFGNPETTAGGTALKFYASIRLDIRRIESIGGKGDEEPIGNRVRIKVVKNKVAPPLRKVELDMYFGRGVSKAASLLDSAVKHGLIDKKGAWYTANGGVDKIGQGKENATKFLEDNKDYASEIEAKLRAMIFPPRDLSKDKDDKAKDKDAQKSKVIPVDAAQKAEENIKAADAKAAKASKVAAPSATNKATKSAAPSKTAANKDDAANADAMGNGTAADSEGEPLF